MAPVPPVGAAGFELGLETVSAAVHPWSAIGRVNAPRGSCTGVVIGRDSVATAAHCLFNARTRRFARAQSLHFLAGYERGRYRAHARVRSYRIGPGYDPDRPGESFASDWAVLTLDRPLPPEVPALALGPAPAPGGEVLAAGYARGRHEVMTADPSCRALRVSHALIASDCRGQEGFSGGPLIERQDGEPRLVGINVAGRAARGLQGAQPGLIAVPAATILRLLPTAPEPSAGD